MTGKELKQKIDLLNVTQKQLADKLNVTPQSVNAVYTAKDVRSGTIEKIASVLGVDMSYFYPSSTVTNTNIQANNASGNIAGGNQTIQGSSELLDIIRKQQETINQLMAIINK